MCNSSDRPIVIRLYVFGFLAIIMFLGLIESDQYKEQIMYAAGLVVSAQALLAMIIKNWMLQNRDMVIREIRHVGDRG